MQYFRFLPNPAKLRREARWSGVSSVPDIGERVQPSADVGAGTVTAYFVDNGRFGVLVRLKRMLVNGLDAASAAFEVGHESASQFNREYRRFFGKPPLRNIQALRLDNDAAQLLGSARFRR